jgi:hypothetical protein
LDKDQHSKFSFKLISFPLSILYLIVVASILQPLFLFLFFKLS